MRRSDSAWKVFVLALCFCALATGCDPSFPPSAAFPIATNKAIYSTPADFGLVFEDIEVETTGKDALRGWFVPATDPKATVLIHHGTIVNRSVMLDHCRLLHDHQYNTITYDYRGFGDSDGDAMLTHILDDADAMLAALDSRADRGSDRIILFGSSLGTLPTFAQAARGRHDIIGIVLEGSFPGELPVWSLPLIGLPPIPGASCGIPAELNPMPHALEATVPKLFMQSRDDALTPLDDARRLYEATAGPKQFVELTGPHTRGINVDAAYSAALIEFLDECVAETESNRP